MRSCVNMDKRLFIYIYQYMCIYASIYVGMWTHWDISRYIGVCVCIRVKMWTVFGVLESKLAMKTWINIIHKRLYAYCPTTTYFPCYSHPNAASISSSSRLHIYLCPLSPSLTVKACLILLLYWQYTQKGPLDVCQLVYTITS